VQGTILAASLPQAVGNVFNIGNGRETSVLQVAQLVKEMTGSPSPIVFVPYEEAYGSNFEESLHRLPDTSKAEKLLGFKAKVPLEEGLKRTIAWFRENMR